MRLSVTNLLWLLCSSPFLFFALTKFLVVQQNLPNESLMMNWLMGIVAPFTFFPATAAMFSVVRKWVMGETDAKLLKTYFKGYKDNYVQSMIGGIFYTLLFVIMYIDYTVYMTQLKDFQVVGFVMLALLIVLFVSMFNFFSMVAHYHMKTFQLLKNSVLLTIIRPLRPILTVVVSLILGYISLRFPFIIIFFLGSIVSAIAFYNFYMVYLKMQAQLEKSEKEKESEGGQDENGTVV